MKSKSVRNKSEGFVLVWTAVLLTLLLLMAALSVDLGFWYRNKNQAQQAADAAAAAGVIYRSIGGSDDFTGAEMAARDAAKANGFSDSEIEVSRFNLDTGVQLQANQLYVRVTRESPNFFLNIVGMDRSRITARSIAEFEPPLAIGSPCNSLGRQPGPNLGAGTPCADEANNSLLWLDIHGPQTPVYSGDQFSSQNCTPVPAVLSGGRPAISPPSPSRIPTVCDGGVNQSWLGNGQSGYEYILRVLPNGAGKPVSVDVFDPAFTNTGASCEESPANRLRLIAENYNVQVDNAVNYYNNQRNALIAEINQYTNNLAFIENRLDDLIGSDAGGTISDPRDTRNGVPSHLKTLKSGVPPTGSPEEQRVNEITTSWTNSTPTGPNGLYWGTWGDTQYYGTSFRTVQPAPADRAKHGMYPTANLLPAPPSSILQQKFCSLSLRFRTVECWTSAPALV